jgi:hypothetical protein
MRDTSERRDDQYTSGSPLFGMVFLRVESIVDTTHVNARWNLDGSQLEANWELTVSQLEANWK